MKEIISYGYKNNIKYNNTCPYCFCQYTYQEEDTYMCYNLTYASKAVLCPDCGKENIAFNYINKIGGIYDQ